MAEAEGQSEVGAAAQRVSTAQRIGYAIASAREGGDAVARRLPVADFDRPPPPVSGLPRSRSPAEDMRRVLSHRKFKCKRCEDQLLMLSYNFGKVTCKSCDSPTAPRGVVAGCCECGGIVCTLCIAAGDQFLMWADALNSEQMRDRALAKLALEWQISALLLSRAPAVAGTSPLTLLNGVGLSPAPLAALASAGAAPSSSWAAAMSHTSAAPAMAGTAAAAAAAVAGTSGIGQQWATGQRPLPLLRLVARPSWYHGRECYWDPDERRWAYVDSEDFTLKWWSD